MFHSIKVKSASIHVEQPAQTSCSPIELGIQLMVENEDSLRQIIRCACTTIKPVNESRLQRTKAKLFPLATHHLQRIGAHLHEMDVQ